MERTMEEIAQEVRPELIEWAAKISTTDCTKVESPLVLDWVQQIFALGHKAGFIEGFSK